MEKESCFLFFFLAVGCHFTRNANVQIARPVHKRNFLIGKKTENLKQKCFFVVNRFDLCFRCFRLYLMFCFFFAVGATTLVPANIFLNVRVCEKLINAVVLMRFLLKKRSAKAGSLVSCRTDALLCVLPIELAGLTQGRRRARLRPNALPQPRG